METLNHRNGLEVVNPHETYQFKSQMQLCVEHSTYPHQGIILKRPVPIFSPIIFQLSYFFHFVQWLREYANWKKMLAHMIPFQEWAKYISYEGYPKNFCARQKRPWNEYFCRFCEHFQSATIFHKNLFDLQLTGVFPWRSTFDFADCRIRMP